MKNVTLAETMVSIKEQVATAELLFEEEAATSKKDIKGEQAYEELRAKLNPRMWDVVKLLRQDPEGLWAMCDKDKIENITLNKLALAQWLSFDDEQVNYMINSTIKVLVRETVMHEQALTATLAMVTKRIEDLFKGKLLHIKQKLEQGDIEFKTAAQLVLITKYLGFCKIKRRAANSNLHVAFKHSYDILHFVLDINEDLKKYLLKRKNVEPVTFNPYTKLEFSGSFNKFNEVQPPCVEHVVAKLQAVPFKLNNHVLTNRTFKQKLVTTLPMGEITKLGDILSQFDNKNYYFPTAFGPDNGRIYSKGYLIPAQQGGRNWMTQFSNERTLDEVGLRHLQTKLDSYAGKDMLKAPAKKSLEYINYVDAMDKHNQGLPVGNMLGLDGILMGMQTHALLLRDKVQYNYCVLDDGRNHMATALGLTKEEVKGGISPYSYGAGQNTTIAGIINASDRDLSAVLTKDFWAQWEIEFQQYFPATYKLRQFMRGYVRATKLGHRVDYTTWFGFNATVTPLQTITTTHHTVLGKREYVREDIKLNEFGAKLIAAVGHELDSSILCKLVLMADYEIKPVHDEYCVHPNDGDKLVRDFTAVAKQLVVDGPEHLQTLINQMFAPYSEMYGTISVLPLISNTLTVDDVVCGIN